MDSYEAKRVAVIRHLGVVAHPGEYDLGYDTTVLRFVRLRRYPNRHIPVGCVRIVRFNKHRHLYIGRWSVIYDRDGMLMPQYWSLPRR